MGQRMTDGLTGLGLGLARNGTGVNDDQIGILGLHHGKAQAHKIGSDTVRLNPVDTTSEVDDGNMGCEHAGSLIEDIVEGTLDTVGHRLLTGSDVIAHLIGKSKEPVVWYQLGELMKNAKNRVKIHTPYIICNDMMYNTWEEIAENVSDFSIMTNSVANNGNPFGAADYAKNRNRILSTGINIWEYEGGYSYHGKSILIDDDLSVIGSFNMDMRSAYLDTELMLVIRSKDINKQLEEGMMEYERVSRQVLEDGTYRDPYHVEPIELTKKRQRKIFLVQHLLGWARYLF